MDTSEENGIPDRYGDEKGLIPVCCSLCMKLLKQVDKKLVKYSYKQLSPAVRVNDESELPGSLGVSVNTRMIECVARTVADHQKEIGIVLPKGILSSLSRTNKKK